MNRNSSIWMDSPNKLGMNSFGNNGNNVQSYNMWDNRNDMGSRFQGGGGNVNSGRNIGDREMMLDVDRKPDNSFLNFLEHRNSQPQESMSNQMMSQRFGDVKPFDDGDWNRGGDFNSSPMNTSMRGNGNRMSGGGGGPLLGEQSQNMRRGSGLLHLPEMERNNSTVPREDFSSRMNSGSQRSSFGNNNSNFGTSNSNFGSNNSNFGNNNSNFGNNDQDKPIVLTIQQSDIGSKIIGKNGVLIRDLENRSGARIEVIDRKGTNRAVVELYGSSNQQNCALQLITNKCNPINIEFPNGKPQPLFEKMGNSTGFCGMNSPPKSNYEDFRQNSFGADGNFGGNNQGYGQGLLKSPLCPQPNMEMPYWRQGPKQLTTSGRGRGKAGFQGNSRNRSNFNSNRPNFNSGKKVNANPQKSNSNQPNKNQGSKKRQFKNKNNNSGNKQPPKDANNGPPANKKTKRGDLYSDSDFALEPENVKASLIESQLDGLTDLAQSLTEVRNDFDPPSVGPNPLSSWTNNAKLVIDHFASENIETGFQLLKKLHGIVVFQPFRQLAQFACCSSKLRLVTTPEMPPLKVYLNRKLAEGVETVLPASAFQLSILLKRLQQGYSFTTAGKFSEGIDTFRSILYTIPFLIASDKVEMAKVRKLAIICREYITGLSLEMSRLELSKDAPEDQKRNCELAAYFTRCNLQSSHRMLTLSTALNLFFKMKNFKTAVSFARRLLEYEPSAEMIPQLNKIVEVCNSNLVDAFEIDYDDTKQFTFCSQTFQRIAPAEQDLRCPFCHVRCSVKCKGQVCKVCAVAELGLATSSHGEA